MVRHLGAQPCHTQENLEHHVTSYWFSWLILAHLQTAKCRTIKKINENVMAWELGQKQFTGPARLLTSGTCTEWSAPHVQRRNSNASNPYIIYERGKSNVMATAIKSLHKSEKNKLWSCENLYVKTNSKGFFPELNCLLPPASQHHKQHSDLVQLLVLQN